MKLASSIPQILSNSYESRCTRNSNYSLRAFARDLELSSASLTLILKGKQGLSVGAADRISNKLGFTDKEKEYFRDLVLSIHSRSDRNRRLAAIRLRQYDTAGATLELEMFKVISDWYHFAILELVELPGFVNSTKWISKNLGIPEKTAELAIERLKKVELLEEDVDGGWRRTTDFVATPSGIPSEALKKYHTQLIDKGKAALYSQPVSERDFSGVQFAVAPEEIPWAKDQIKQFRRSLMSQMERNPRRDRVYCLAIQFFSLQQSAQVQTTVTNNERPNNHENK